MKILIQPTVKAPQTFYRPTSPNHIRQAASEFSSSIVTVSQEGKRLSQAPSSKFGVVALDKVQTLDELKDTLKGADFHSMSPEETAHLTGALERTGKFDRNSINTFFIGLDTVTPLSRDEKVDVVEHFNMMQSVVQEAVKSDPDFAYSVELRKKGIQLLNTLIGWTA